MKGHYTYVDGNGMNRRVDYVADNNGFRASGKGINEHRQVMRVSNVTHTPTYLLPLKNQMRAVNSTVGLFICVRSVKSPVWECSDEN